MHRQENETADWLSMPANISATAEVIIGAANAGLEVADVARKQQSSQECERVKRLDHETAHKVIQGGHQGVAFEWTRKRVC